MQITQHPRLDDWENRPLHAMTPIPHDAVDASYRRVVGFEAPGPPLPDGAFRAVADAILRYDIFQPWLVRGVLRRTPLQVGDTVGIYVFPLFFAARVAAVFDGQVGEQWRSGFTYQTIVGHPEHGEETFAVEKDLECGRVTVSLDSWSAPGLWLTRLFLPATRWLQRFASHGALVHLHYVADRHRA